MHDQYMSVGATVVEQCENPDCGLDILFRFPNGTVLPVQTSSIFMIDPSLALVWCFRCKFATLLSLVRQQTLPKASFVPFPQLEGLSITAEDLLGAMESRWQEVIKSKKKGRPELALGLRFDVFQRDGFRCQYCGLSARDGALLHADHVIPESKGGPTTMENLVTACVDCNLGKSDKDLEPEMVRMFSSAVDCAKIDAIT